LDSNDDAGQYEYDYRRVLFYNFSILPDSSAASVYTLATPTGTHVLNIKERFSTILSRYLTLEGETISFVLTPKIENNVPKYVFKQFSKSYSGDAENRSKITNGTGNPPYSVTSSGVTESIQDLEWDNLTFVSSLNSCFKDGTIGQDIINYYAEYDRLLQVSFGVNRSINEAKQLLQLDGTSTKIVSKITGKYLILDASTDASKLESSGNYAIIFKMLVREGGDVKVNISTNQPNVYRIKQWSTLSSGIITTDSKVVVNNTTNNTDFGESVVTSLSSDTAHTGFGVTTMSITNMSADATGQYIAEIIKTYSIAAPQYITGYTTRGMATQGGKIGNDDNPYTLNGNKVLSPNGYRYDDGLKAYYSVTVYDGYIYKGFIINEPTNPAGNNIVSGKITDDSQFVSKLINENYILFTEAQITPTEESRLILDEDITSIYFVFREKQYLINHDYIYMEESLEIDPSQGTLPVTEFAPLKNLPDFNDKIVVDGFIGEHYVIGYFGEYDIWSVKGPEDVYIAKYFASNNVLFESTKDLTLSDLNESNLEINEESVLLKSYMLDSDKFVAKNLDEYFGTGDSENITFGSQLSDSVTVYTYVISIEKYTITSVVSNESNSINVGNYPEIKGMNTFTASPSYTSLPNSNSYIVESGSKVIMTTIYTKFDNNETVIGSNNKTYNYKNLHYFELYKRINNSDNSVSYWPASGWTIEYDYNNSIIRFVLEKSDQTMQGDYFIVYRLREQVELIYSMQDGSEVDPEVASAYQLNVNGTIITSDMIAYEGDSEADRENYTYTITNNTYNNGDIFWVYVGDIIDYELEMITDNEASLIYNARRMEIEALNYTPVGAEINPLIIVREENDTNINVDDYVMLESEKTNITISFTKNKKLIFELDNRYQDVEIKDISRMFVFDTEHSVLLNGFSFGDARYVNLSDDGKKLSIYIETGSIIAINITPITNYDQYTYRFNYIKRNNIKELEFDPDLYGVENKIIENGSVKLDYNEIPQDAIFTHIIPIDENLLDKVDNVFYFNYIQTYNIQYYTSPIEIAEFEVTNQIDSALLDDGLITGFCYYGGFHYDYSSDLSVKINLDLPYRFEGWEINSQKPYIGATVGTYKDVVTTNEYSMFKKVLDNAYTLIAHFSAKGSYYTIFGDGEIKINDSEVNMRNQITTGGFVPSGAKVKIEAIPNKDASVVVENCFFRYLRNDTYYYYTTSTKDSDNKPSLSIVKNSDGSVEFTYNNEDLYVVECYFEFKSKSWAMEEFVSTPVGDGTINNPYIIDSPNKLAYIARSLSATNRASSNPTLNKYYKLTQNIDLSDHYWFPIGTRQTGGWPFSGYFDGNG
ncbi:MAG: hypothetical protein MR288_04665, partial [Firmicutes bacterium]|nr:hypothetical protein [Bacillota bacterium]